jgi:hypothetical protein
MELIPSGPRRRRGDAARFLTENGYPTAPTTLAKLASIGGGPEFIKFGRIPIYEDEKLLEWASSRCSKPRRSTSEAG